MTDIRTNVRTRDLTFSVALDVIKMGMKVKRHGWQEGTALFLVQGSRFKVNRAPLNQFYEEGVELQYRPHLDRCFEDGSIGPWNPSSGDLLAEDWEICE
jgi:hypothetical protein